MLLNCSTSCSLLEIVCSGDTLLCPMNSEILLQFCHMSAESGCYQWFHEMLLSWSVSHSWLAGHKKGCAHVPTGLKTLRSAILATTISSFTCTMFLLICYGWAHTVHAGCRPGGKWITVKPRNSFILGLLAITGVFLSLQIAIKQNQTIEHTEFCVSSPFSSLILCSSCMGKYWTSSMTVFISNNFVLI